MSGWGCVCAGAREGHVRGELAGAHHGQDEQLYGKTNTVSEGHEAVLGLRHGRAEDGAGQQYAWPWRLLGLIWYGAGARHVLLPGPGTC